MMLTQGFVTFSVSYIFLLLCLPIAVFRGGDFNIGIKNDFPLINFLKVLREVLKTDNTSETEKMFANFILRPYHHSLTRARIL